jgi:hypothetical protein
MAATLANIGMTKYEYLSFKLTKNIRETSDIYIVFNWNEGSKWPTENEFIFWHWKIRNYSIEQSAQSLSFTYKMALEIQCVCAILENDAPGWPLSTNLMRHSQNQCVNGARAQARVIPEIHCTVRVLHKEFLVAKNGSLIRGNEITKLLVYSLVLRFFIVLRICKLSMRSVLFNFNFELMLLFTEYFKIDLEQFRASLLHYRYWVRN